MGVAATLALGACSESSSGGDPAGGDAGSGGNAAAGGAGTSTGGAALGTGGSAASGGAQGATGGSAASGGAQGSAGGAQGGGGSTATGGASSTGGSIGTGGAGAGGAAPDGGLPVRLPPENAAFDYQLGGAYPPPQGVAIVSRDRTESPAPGLYNICYLNGFQTQPGEEGSWDADLILRDAQGDPVIDPDWNEMLLDVSTESKRTRIAAVVGGWIAQCAADGFDAVEIDNLDTYSRSGGRITQDNAVAFLALLSARAHAEGLAIAQKNSTEILSRRAEMGTDFAVAEECSRYDECGDYVSVYDNHVLMIEYRDGDFTQGCQDYGATHSIVRRDLNLVPAGRPAYVFEGC